MAGCWLGWRPLGAAACAFFLFLPAGRRVQRALLLHVGDSGGGGGGGPLVLSPCGLLVCVGSSSSCARAGGGGVLLCGVHARGHTLHPALLFTVQEPIKVAIVHTETNGQTRRRKGQGYQLGLGPRESRRDSELREAAEVAEPRTEKKKEKEEAEKRPLTLTQSQQYTHSTYLHFYSCLRAKHL